MMTWSRSVATRGLMAGMLLMDGTAGAGLHPETLAGWEAYVRSVEARRSAELTGRAPFLVMDRERGAAADRRSALQGALVVRQTMPDTLTGTVPRALVHHWRGVAFVPGVTVDEVIERLKEGPPPQADVLAWRLLERGHDRMRVYLRLRRTKVVTAVYNTEHLVTFSRHGPGRAASSSAATRIAEVKNPGSRTERELGPGEDRGFLWRLNAYWRFEAAEGGVLAECESISLSRTVPFGLGPIVGRLVNGVARESMERALEAMKTLGRT